MSWRLSFQSAKLLFSYLIPSKLKTFRDAIFDGNVQTIRELATEQPRLLQQSIDADGNTALGIQIFEVIGRDSVPSEKNKHHLSNK